jgi:hypothetical protein
MYFKYKLWMLLSPHAKKFLKASDLELLLVACCAAGVRLTNPGAGLLQRPVVTPHRWGSRDWSQLPHL